MKTYVYRGVRYTKDANDAITHNQNHKVFDLAKVYRGIGYTIAPKWDYHRIDHVYRGAHYVA